MTTFAADFNTHRFAALFYGNGHPEGFDSKVLLSNSLGEKASTKTYFYFCNYDHKNAIENLKTQKHSLLDFPVQVLFEAEKEFGFNNLDEIYKPTNFKNHNINIIAKTSKNKYIENVVKLKEHIQQGDIYEINYCVTFEATGVDLDPIEIYYKLNKISQAPYSALVKLDDKFIICSSPELFLSKRQNKLITKPIKGTAVRSSDETEDEKLKKELYESLKERTENVMIVDVARNDLSRLAKKGTVNVNELYHIESYRQVHQMVSTVSCELNEMVSFDDIIKATFPMASMTGAPKIRAMQLIDDYETQNRGPFSGCVGYINNNGDLDLNVLIRSIFHNKKEKYLSFSVGSAITHLCDPEKEYEECMVKAKALIEVLS